jgi:hypothetical protein
VAVTRADRRKARQARVELLFGPRVAPSALDLLEIVELAWHDCYREITPPEDIIDDLLLLSRGQLDRLVSACRLAVTDWRDVKVAADLIRNPAS